VFAALIVSQDRATLFSRKFFQVLSNLGSASMMLTTEHMLAAIESPTLRGLIAQRLEVDEDELEAMLDDNSETLADAIIEVLIDDGPLIDELIGPVPDDDDEEPFSISVFGVEGLFIVMTSTDEMHGGFDTAQDAFDFIDREYERELASPDDLE
jgi:hypothetical protein